MISTWIKESIDLLRNVKLHTSQSTVGLDIGQESIKALEFSNSSHTVVEHFSITPYSRVYKAEEGKLMLAEIEKKISEIFTTSKLKAADVAIAVPRLLTMVKNFNVDSRLTLSEIESRVWIEARRLFPDLIADSYIDFSILGTSPTNPDQQNILLIACRKEVIDPYQAMFKKNNIHLSMVDVSAYALSRSLLVINKQDQAMDTVALLNMDVEVMTLIVMHKGAIIHIVEKNYNGVNLRKQLSLISNNTVPAIPENNPSADDVYFNIFREEIMSYFKHTLQFTHLGKENVDTQKIYISGDLSTLPRLEKFINHVTHIPVELADPFKNCTFASTIPKELIAENRSKMLMSYGLTFSKVE